jgi:hypothetical protein
MALAHNGMLLAVTATMECGVGESWGLEIVAKTAWYLPHL